MGLHGGKGHYSKHASVGAWRQMCSEVEGFEKSAFRLENSQSRSSMAGDDQKTYLIKSEFSVYWYVHNVRDSLQSRPFKQCE